MVAVAGQPVSPEPSATIAAGGRRAIGDLRRIAVWGHYHGHNLGDEMVVSTIVSAVRRRRPLAEIVGVSMTTGDTVARHGIKAYPINPGMPVFRPRGEDLSSRGTRASVIAWSRASPERARSIVRSRSRG